MHFIQNMQHHLSHHEVNLIRGHTDKINNQEIAKKKNMLFHINPSPDY
jgi:hypothetical protein